MQFSDATTFKTDILEISDFCPDSLLLSLSQRFLETLGRTVLLLYQ